jgi:hypoxanthine phosphoribosyltransferase
LRQASEENSRLISLPLPDSQRGKKNMTEVTLDTHNKKIFSPRVLTLDQQAFEATCCDLYRMVMADGFRPDYLVGIASGGLFVAQAIKQLCCPDIPLIELSYGRPTTSLKRDLNCGVLLRHLPYAVTDMLRIAESNIEKLVERTGRSSTKKSVEQNPDVVRSIAAIRGSSILVVDDAVDSGSTLDRALSSLEPAISNGCQVRTAVITQSRQPTRRMPDYLIYRNLLVRFPWSNDFSGPKRKPS